MPLRPVTLGLGWTTVLTPVPTLAPELAVTPGLAVAPELTVTPGLAVAPELTVTPGLAVAPELAVAPGLAEGPALALVPLTWLPWQVLPPAVNRKLPPAIPIGTIASPNTIRRAHAASRIRPVRSIPVTRCPPTPAECRSPANVPFRR
jgi:hypothetical protein